MKYKVGIIGLGRAGTTHVASCTRISNIDEIIVCDMNEKRLKDITNKYNIEKSYTKVEHMYEGEKLDITIISVPTQQHKKYLELALNHNQHILIEKPLACNLAEVDECIRLARGYNRKIMVDENFRWHPDFSVVTDFINKGVIGIPYWSKVELLRLVTEDPTLSKWLYDLKYRWLLEDGVHWVDLFNVWLDVPAKKVFAHFPLVPPEKENKSDIFDIVHTIYEDGKGATLIQNFASRGFGPFEEGYQSTVEVRVEGSEGSISVTWGNQVPMSNKDTTVRIDSKNIGGTIYPTLIDRGHYWEGTGQAVIEDFIDCIENDTEPKVSMEDEHRALEVIFGAYDSAASGNTIDLPLSNYTR